MKSYFIKSGYTHKTASEMPAHEVGYWTRDRVRASYFYQYEVYRFARRVIAERDCQTILDVGCGPGTKLAMLSKWFPSRAFVGVDLPEAIEYARKAYTSCKWEVTDLNAPGMSGSGVKADLIICSDVIEHVTDPDILLDYIRGRLRSDGRLILSTPERDLLHGVGATSAHNRYHVREWNAAEFESYVLSAGFEIEQHLLQYPVRMWLNSIFYDEIVRRAFARQSLKYNQVVLLRAT